MKYRSIIFFVLGLWIAQGVSFAEDVSVSTYYPSPYGNYKSLTVTEASTDSLTMKDGFISLQRSDLLGGVIGASGILRSSPTAQGVELATTSNDPLWFSTNATERVRIASNGNVGINQPNPSALLEVRDADPNFGSINFFPSTPHTFDVTYDGGADGFFVFQNTSQAGSSRTSFATYEGLERLTIAKSGNVGIGTSAPGAKLELNLANSAGWNGNLSAFRVYSPDNAYFLDMATYVVPNTTYSGYKFSPNGQDVNGFSITTLGNFGIGNNTPETKLDVNGSITTRGPRTYIKGLDGSGSHWIVVGPDTIPNYVLGFDNNGKSLNLGLEQGGSAWNLRVSKDVSVVGNVYAAGNITTSGRFISSTKNFLIDSPLDPEHKYLVHACIEGPENAVFYRGEASLERGKAVVALPKYFEKLVRKEGRTVLLTPIFEGDEAISELASSSVRDGKFTVRSIDSRNQSQKFYWEVKAVRSDVPALKAEVLKTDESFRR